MIAGSTDSVCVCLCVCLLPDMPWNILSEASYAKDKRLVLVAGPFTLQNVESDHCYTTAAGQHFLVKLIKWHPFLMAYVVATDIGIRYT